MGRFVVALVYAMVAWTGPQPGEGAKTLFYDPGSAGLSPAPDPPLRLRPIRHVASARRADGSLVHGGIHYWLESDNGAPIYEAAAREKPGRYSLHIRNNVGSGFLTVWDVNGEGRELTPREDPRWSGFRPGLDEYVVPGTFEFASDESAAHVVIVWAWSQSEVGRDPASARRRVSEMSAWKRNGVAAIIRESDDATPGEIGTYVVNRAEGGVVAEILFRR